MSTPSVIVVMGVSGSGKTTVGAAVAGRLDVEYADADDFHPPANIAKMSAGVPLDDADRAPWLDSIAEWMRSHVGVKGPNRPGGVISCSALHRAYRDRLRAGAPDAAFLHLAGPPEVIARRIAGRTAHFMPASLLQSQFDTLEPLAPDEHGVTLDVSLPVSTLVGQFMTWLEAS